MESDHNNNDRRQLVLAGEMAMNSHLSDQSSNASTLKRAFMLSRVHENKGMLKNHISRILTQKRADNHQTI